MSTSVGSNHRFSWSLRRLPDRLSGFAVANLLRAVISAGALASLPELHADMIRDGLNAGPYQVGSQAVCYMAIVAVLWWPRAGLVVTLIALALTMRGPLGGVEPIVVMVSVVVVLCKCSGMLIALLLAAITAWTVALGFTRPTTEPAWTMSMFLAGAVCVGYAARVLLIGRLREKRRAALLEFENATIRQVERDCLSRDLHDIVAYRVSQIAMQVRGHRDSEDPQELRDALDEVGGLARSSMAELRGLVEALRGEGSDDLPIVRVTVGDAAQRACDDLAQYGHDVTCEVSSGMDELGGAIQETIVRIIAEATANVLKYAPDGAPCLVSAKVGPVSVRVSVVSPCGNGTATLPDWESSGLGLRGLRERILLLGGSFVAGKEDEQWLVKATLPLNPA